MSIEYTNKLHPGADFPAIEVKLLNGEVKNLAKPENGLDWKLIVVYRLSLIHISEPTRRS